MDTEAGDPQEECLKGSGDPLSHLKFFTRNVGRKLSIRGVLGTHRDMLAKGRLHRLDLALARGLRIGWSYRLVLPPEGGGILCSYYHRHGESSMAEPTGMWFCRTRVARHILRMKCYLLSSSAFFSTYEKRGLLFQGFVSHTQPPPCAITIYEHGYRYLYTRQHRVGFS